MLPPYFLARQVIMGLATGVAIAWRYLRRGEIPWTPNLAKMRRNKQRQIGKALAADAGMLKDGIKIYYNFLKTLLKDRPPDYQVAAGYSQSFFFDYYRQSLSAMSRNPEKFVWHEDMVPPPVIQAMGLTTFMIELPTMLITLVSPETTHQYIDMAENTGYPGDICSLLRSTLGQVMDDFLPPPQAIVTSNSPCNAATAYYVSMEQETKVPVFRLNLPWHIYQPRAKEYFIKEVWQMVAFLEDVTGHKLDMDKLKEICDKRNQVLEYTLQLWELLKAKPAPMGGEMILYSHFCLNTVPGSDLALKTIKQMLDVAQRNFKQGKGLVPNEKHRVIFWNTPPLVAADLFHWLELEYQTVVLMDMVTYNRHPIIDTSSEEAMMWDLVESLLQVPMTRHGSGPVEFFFNDLFRIYDEFNADMIIMGGHRTCKNALATINMLRDHCRKKGIPLLVLDYEFCDSRVVSFEELKQQSANFMDTVMA